MDTIKQFLENKPLYVPEHQYLSQFAEKMQIDVTDELQQVIKQVNPYRLGLVQTVKKNIDLSGDLPACYTRTNNTYAIASKSGVVSMFDVSNYKLPKQQLTIPNAKISHLLMVDDPQAIITVQQQSLISVYMKGGMIQKSLREQFVIKEHQERQSIITCLEMLPCYQINDQVEHSIISADQGGNIVVTKNILNKPQSQRVAKLNEAVININVFKLNKIKLLEFQQQQFNNVPFITLLAVSTASKCSLYILNMISNDQILIHQIGQPVTKSSENTQQVFFSSSSFFLNDQKQLLFACNFENELLINKLLLRDTQSFKEVEITTVQQLNLQTDEKLVQIQLLNNQEILCFGQDKYQIIDPFNNEIIEQLNYDHKLAGYQNQFICKHNNQFEILAFDNQTSILEFQQPTLEERITKLSQNQPLCAFELLISLGMKNNNNFKTQSELLIDQKEKIDALKNDDQCLFCAVQQKYQDLCCKIIIDQLNNESYLSQILMLAQSQNLLEEKFIIQLTNYILSACLFTAILFSQVANVLTKWKGSNQTQDFIKQQLIKILITQLSKYQIPLQATILNYLINQLNKQFNQQNYQYYQLVLAQLTINSYDSQYFEQLFTLVENNFLYYIIPTLFFHILNKDYIITINAPNQQQQKLTTYQYYLKYFQKWILVNLKTKSNMEMSDAFSFLFQTILSSDNKLVQQNYVTNIIIDLKEVVNLNTADKLGQDCTVQLTPESIESMNIIKGCNSFYNNQFQVNNFDQLKEKQKIYILPTYLNNQSFLNLYNKSSYDYFIKKHYNTFLEDFYKWTVQKPIMINEQTQFFTVWNIVNPNGQFYVYNYLINNNQMDNEQFQNFRIQILNNIYNQLFNQQEISQRISQNACYIANIMLSLLRAESNNNYQYQFLNNLQNEYNQLKNQFNIDQVEFKQFELNQLISIKLSPQHYQLLASACLNFSECNNEIQLSQTFKINQEFAQVDLNQLYANCNSVVAVYLCPSLIILKDLLGIVNTQKQLNQSESTIISFSENINNFLFLLQYGKLDNKLLSKLVDKYANFLENQQKNTNQTLVFKLLCSDLARDYDRSIQILQHIDAQLCVKYLQVFEVFSRFFFKISKNSKLEDNIQQCNKGCQMLQQCFKQIFNQIVKVTTKQLQQQKQIQKQQDEKLQQKENEDSQNHDQIKSDNSQQDKESEEDQFQNQREIINKEVIQSEIFKQLQFDLLQTICRLFKYAPNDAIAMLLQKDKYNELLSEYLLILIDPLFMDNSFTNIDIYNDLHAQIRKSVSQITNTDPGAYEMLFTSQTANLQNFKLQQQSAMTKCNYQILLCLSKHLNSQKFQQLLQKYQKHLLQNQQAIDQFITDNQNQIENGLYMLKLNKQDNQLRQILMLNFEEIANKQPDNLINYIDNCFKIYLTEKLNNNNKQQYFKFLQIAFKIQQEIKFLILNKLAAVYEKLMTVDQLCSLFFELFQNASWGEAHKLLDGIIQQIDISNDMKREQVNVAALDVQNCCMHKTNYLKTGVYCNTGICICGKSVNDVLEQTHITGIQLQDYSKLDIKVVEQNNGCYYFACGHCCHHSCLNETKESLEQRDVVIEQRICGKTVDQTYYTAIREVKCPECH